MTIGYGDISARCTSTRGFSMVAMLLGSSMYAYSLNYLMTYLNSSILRASNIIGDRMVRCPPTHFPTCQPNPTHPLTSTHK